MKIRLKLVKVREKHIVSAHYGIFLNVDQHAWTWAEFLSLSRSKPLNQSLSSDIHIKLFNLEHGKSLNLQTSGMFWYCFNQSFNLWKTFLLAGWGAERKRDWNSTKETREKTQDIKFAKTPKHHQSTPGNITKPSTRPEKTLEKFPFVSCLSFGGGRGSVQWSKCLPREAGLHLLPGERSATLVHHLTYHSCRAYGGWQPGDYGALVVFFGLVYRHK